MLRRKHERVAKVRVYSKAAPRSAPVCVHLCTCVFVCDVLCACKMHECMSVLSIQGGETYGQAIQCMSCIRCISCKVQIRLWGKADHTLRNGLSGLTRYGKNGGVSKGLNFMAKKHPIWVLEDKSLSPKRGQIMK